MNAGVTKRAVLAVAFLWLGCGPPPPPPAAPVAPVEPRPQDFSGERAAVHLEALAAIGPRAAGSDAARRAREYIASALRELGLEVREQRSRVELGSPAEVFETVNLVAAIRGDSSDVVLLVAPYDSSSGADGASDGSSGPALVLELARALEVRRVPYTVSLAFVEGDALVRAGAPKPPARRVAGTDALVAALDAEDRLERVRVAVYFDRVADPDLRVARDLLSNRTWREEFWTAARRLGSTGAFAPDSPFESAQAGHRAFLEVGMRSAVAIVGARSEASPPGEGSSASPAEDPAQRSTESLAVVGAVSIDALVAIAQRLAKIDRFVESPVAASAPAEPPAEPDAGAAP